MLNFLKSLVLPSHMVKHRSMSVLFSICILVLTCYMFSLPVGNFYIKNKETFASSEEVHAQALVNVSEDNVEANAAAQLIINAGLHYDEKGAVTVKEELGPEYKVVSEPYLAYTRELTKKVRDESGNESDVKYTETCYVSLGIYIDVDTDGDGEDKIVPFTESEIYKNFNDVELVENEKRVLVIFTPTSIYYQVGQILVTEEGQTPEISDELKALYAESAALEIPYTTSILFTTMKYDFNNMGTTAKSLTASVASILSNNYAATNNMVYILMSVLPSCILFPLLICLLFWLFFKKNGQLKKFREYLNIYAICSIIPTILCFAIGFFWIYAIEYFIYVSSIVYLFYLYKINSSTTLV